MRELRRTNDVVYLSFAQAALRSAGLDVVVLDEAQSVVDGSIGVIPRRLMAPDHQVEMALQILADLEAELGDQPK